jgi:DNA repair exonuclease SbcCD ATPase subunit
MKRVDFKKISVKNFLSVGEESVVVNFQKGLNVITGINKDKPERRNAIGKSTIADAIYFAIFGETLREIKKDLITNNITGGTTTVELEFDVTTPAGSSSYRVIRSLAPTRVYVFENEVDKTHDTTANTTKYICNILSASPAIFKNCVIMTVNNAVPFMAKNKIEKRKFIEDIFGLEVFSEMISHLRAEYNEKKREFDTKNNTLQEIENTYSNYVTQRDLIIKRRQEKKKLYLERKASNIAEKQKIEKEIDTLIIPDVESIKVNIQACEDGIEKCNERITSITSSIAIEKQNISNLKSKHDSIGTSEDKCPVCLRKLEEGDITHITAEKNLIKEELRQLSEKIKEGAQTLQEITTRKETIKSKIVSLRATVSSASFTQQDKNNKIEKIGQLDKWLSELEEDIKLVDVTNTDFDDVISATQGRLDVISTEVDSLRCDLSKLDIVKYVVSEEGVKSYIVNKLLGLLNSRLLFYLQKLDSNSICVFNEYFEEEILNEKNKVCSYFNFSGAERKSIDLACLFTFSDIRRMQGGVQYNIAIYDELFDSSFDDKGIELVTSILQDRVEEMNECILVISHRKESIKAVTGDIIFLQKENGITKRIAYEEI